MKDFIQLTQVGGARVSIRASHISAIAPSRGVTSRISLNANSPFMDVEETQDEILEKIRVVEWPNILGPVPTPALDLDTVNSMESPPLCVGCWMVYLDIPLSEDVKVTNIVVWNLTTGSILFEERVILPFPKARARFQKHIVITLAAEARIAVFADGLAVPGASVKYLRINP